MRIRYVLIGVVLSLVCGAPAFAQSVPLAQVLPDLLLKGVTMQSTTQTVAGNPHEAHFIAALGQTPVPWEINKRLVAQLSTFPLGSSSAGFVFNFDPGTGLFTPASQSFGPGFAERALTTGKGRFGFGANYQRLEFKSFEDIDLQDGSFVYVLQHNDCCAVAGNPTPDPEDPFFEGDLVHMSLSLGIKTAVFAPSLSYGVTNRWDVGVVVPIAHVELTPSATSVIDRIATGSNSLIHSWDGSGGTTKTESLSGSATGIGDIVLRTKYKVFEAAPAAIAGGVDLRLPTGDKENLLGTGAVQAKLSVIASGELGRFAPHVNFGYTFSRGDLSSSLTSLAAGSQPANAATQTQIDNASGVSLGGSLALPDELNYVAGADFAPHTLLTISADLVGRTQRNVDRFDIVSQGYQYRVANSGPLLTTNRDTFTGTTTGNLNLVLGVVGAKFNIPGTPLLLTGSVLFPITSGGLRPKVTPVVGVDYSFKR
jgi:hypothetical protein